MMTSPMCRLSLFYHVSFLNTQFFQVTTIDVLRTDYPQSESLVLALRVLQKEDAPYQTSAALQDVELLASPFLEVSFLNLW